MIIPLAIRRFAVPLVFILLVIVALQSEKAALFGRGDFAVSQVKDRPGVVQFTWRDDIDAPMALRLEAAFEEWAGRADVIILNLSSPGGALREGGKVIDVIDRMKRTHRIDTRVGQGAQCLSMCVPIFLQGQSRTGAANSRWMFHQPILTDVSGEVAEQPDFERNYTADRFFRRYFEPSPMDPVWRERLREDWVGRDVWYTGRQLVDQGSNIINELI